MSIIEQAWMSYPRRKYFIQVNLSILTQKLMQLRMSEVAQADSHQGLLGLLGLKNHQGKGSSQGRSAKMADLFPGNKSAILTEQASQSGSSTLPSPVLSSSANFANQVGEFSQVGFEQKPPQNTPNTPSEVSKPANLQATFNTSEGDISQDLRRVFTPLHARARFLTTNKTTPPPSTTTSETTSSAPNTQTAQGGGGGVFSDRLIWPLSDAGDPKLVALQRMVAAHAFAQTLADDRLQLILDELASGLHRGLVQNPATYLASLLLKEQNGTLLLSAAYDWQAQRELQDRQLAASPAQADRQTLPSPIAASASSTSKPAADQDPRAMRIWSEVLSYLPQVMSDQLIEVWLKPLTVGLDPAGQKLLLCANRFKCEHIKSAYLEKINIALGQALQAHPELLQVSTCQLVTSLPIASPRNP